MCNKLTGNNISNLTRRWKI